MLPDGFADKVMHANLLVGDGMVMVSDGNQPGGPDFRGFALSLTLADEAAVRQAFAALAEGGDITMPLGATFWSPCFGMLRDRFGVGWMLMVHQAAP
jgi:PhnB protein